MYDILIVDDEYFARKNLKDFWKWEDHGCRIKAEVSSAADAIHYLSANHIDIVFTDVSMPETNGIELAEYINKNYSNISVVIFSSYSDFDYVKGAFTHNVIDYILKYEITEELLDGLIEKIVSPKKLKKKKYTEILSLTRSSMTCRIISCTQSFLRRTSPVLNCIPKTTEDC